MSMGQVVISKNHQGRRWSLAWKQSFIWLMSSSPGDQRVSFGENTNYFSKFMRRLWKWNQQWQRFKSFTGCQMQLLGNWRKTGSELTKRDFKVECLWLADMRRPRDTDPLFHLILPGLSWDRRGFLWIPNSIFMKGSMAELLRASPLELASRGLDGSSTTF